MKYLSLLFLLIQQFVVFAQPDTSQGKIGLERYLQQAYHFKSISLGVTNTILRDSSVLEPPHPAYWLTGDFNQDDKPDLLLTATVLKSGKKYPHGALFVLASTGKRYSMVDLPRAVHGGTESYSVYYRADKQYVVMSSLVSEFSRLANGSSSRSLSYRVTHDTVYLKK